MNPPAITLFGHPESGHSYKVALTLAIAGLAHEYRSIDIGMAREARPEPFRSLATFGEVPVLVVDGAPHVQSDAILCVIAELTGQFGGETPARMARVREWLFWEANRLGLSLPHLRYARRFAPEAYPPGAIEWLKGRFDLDIARLALEFADGRLFVIDDAPTIADFALCGYLFWHAQAQVRVPEPVLRWLERISALPNWGAPAALLAPR